MCKHDMVDTFHSDHYLNHNLKRLQHLDSLKIDFNNKSILEVGAGIGDHTDFLLSKNISEILVTDVREENLDYLNKKYQDNKRVKVVFLDIENPIQLEKKYDIVYCYGLLYHLSNPGKAIAFMADYCREYALIETCVSFGNEESINECQEDINNPSQSSSGKGCRPTRIWVYNQLKKYFRHIYMPITQPDHDEFPIDWINKDALSVPLARSIFIASRSKWGNPLLSEDLLDYQTRYSENSYKNKRIYSNDAFEQQRLLLQELSRPVIFDVGAYIGDISKKYMSLFPYAIIHAFEPFDESYKKIEQNLKDFNNIRTYNFAFSNKCGRSAFNINKFHPTNSLLESSNQGEKFWGKDLLDTQNIITIETTTIDDFCSQQNISRIDILKLDTQGSEYMILEGARNMLYKKNISLIYMEIILVETYLGQRLFPEVTDLLGCSGYRLFGIYNSRISKTNDLNQIDAIFIPFEDMVEQ